MEILFIGSSPHANPLDRNQTFFQKNAAMHVEQMIPISFLNIKYVLNT